MGRKKGATNNKVTFIIGMIDCPGGRRYSATGTGYYPSSSPIEGGFVDMRDRPLGTLQVWRRRYY